MVRIGAIAFIIAALTGAPAHAQSVGQMIGQADACYARAYDATHLRAHPRQTVRTFALRNGGPEWRALERNGQTHIAFHFTLVRDSDRYEGVALCTPAGAAMTCGVEGDGGSFTLARAGANLRLTVRNLVAEGARDFSPDLINGDNRVMILYPALATACAPPR